MQGLAAPVQKAVNIPTELTEPSSRPIQGPAVLVFHRSKKWFLNTLTKTVNFQLIVDRSRTIKQTHSGPCSVSVPSIRGMVLKKDVHIPNDLTKPSSRPV